MENLTLTRYGNGHSFGNGTSFDCSAPTREGQTVDDLDTKIPENGHGNGLMAKEVGVGNDNLERPCGCLKKNGVPYSGMCEYHRSEKLSGGLEYRTCAPVAPRTPVRKIGGVRKACKIRKCLHKDGWKDAVARMYFGALRLMYWYDCSRASTLRPSPDALNATLSPVKWVGTRYKECVHCSGLTFVCCKHPLIITEVYSRRNRQVSCASCDWIHQIAPNRFLPMDAEWVEDVGCQCSKFIGPSWGTQAVPPEVTPHEVREQRKALGKFKSIGGGTRDGKAKIGKDGKKKKHVTFKEPARKDELAELDVHHNVPFSKLPKKDLLAEPGWKVHHNGRRVRLYGKGTYKYTGAELVATPKPKWLCVIEEELAAYLKPYVANLSLELALVNHYPSKTGIPWHSDDEVEIDQTYPIISASFGAKTSFSIRTIRGVKKSYCHNLRENTVVVMPAGFQYDWQHMVPPINVGDRINITWRKYVSPAGTEDRPGPVPCRREEEHLATGVKDDRRNESDREVRKIDGIIVDGGGFEAESLSLADEIDREREAMLDQWEAEDCDGGDVGSVQGENQAGLSQDDAAINDLFGIGFADDTGVRRAGDAQRREGGEVVEQHPVVRTGPFEEETALGTGNGRRGRGGSDELRVLHGETRQILGTENVVADALPCFEQDGKSAFIPVGLFRRDQPRRSDLVELETPVQAPANAGNERNGEARIALPAMNEPVVRNDRVLRRMIIEGQRARTMSTHAKVWRRASRWFRKCMAIVVSSIVAGWGLVKRVQNKVSSYVLPARNLAYTLLSNEWAYEIEQDDDELEPALDLGGEEKEEERTPEPVEKAKEVELLPPPPPSKRKEAKVAVIEESEDEDLSDEEAEEADPVEAIIDEAMALPMLETGKGGLPPNWQKELTSYLKGECAFNVRNVVESRVLHRKAMEWLGKFDLKACGIHNPEQLKESTATLVTQVVADTQHAQELNKVLFKAQPVLVRINGFLRSNNTFGGLIPGWVFVLLCFLFFVAHWSHQLYWLNLVFPSFKRRYINVFRKHMFLLSMYQLDLGVMFLRIVFACVEVSLILVGLWRCGNFVARRVRGWKRWGMLAVIVGLLVVGLVFVANQLISGFTEGFSFYEAADKMYDAAGFYWNRVQATPLHMVLIKDTFWSEPHWQVLSDYGIAEWVEKLMGISYVHVPGYWEFATIHHWIGLFATCLAQTVATMVSINKAAQAVRPLVAGN